MAFHWRLSDSKSPQVSRTLLSILAVFNNAVVWMVSARSPTSKSSRSFNNPLVTVPKAPITIGIIATFMFYSFFNSLAMSRYLSLFSHFFSFILWSAGLSLSLFDMVSVCLHVSVYTKLPCLSCLSPHLHLSNNLSLVISIYLSIYLSIYVYISIYISTNTLILVLY